MCVCVRSGRLLEILRKRAAAQNIMPLSILLNSSDKNPKAAEASNSSMLMLLKVVFNEPLYRCHLSLEFFYRMHVQAITMF